jgi:hypothetical protein
LEPVVRNIIQKMSDLKLVSQKQLVDGSSILISGRQRNRFFVFKQKGLQSYFIKQAHEGEAKAEQSIRLEASFYQTVSSSETFCALAPFMPIFFYFDPNTSSLFLGLVDEAKDAGTLARSLGALPKHFAQAIGDITAICHGIRATSIDDSKLQFPLSLHWIFRLMEDPSPLNSLRSRNPASAAAIDTIISNADLMASLSCLNLEWDSCVLIHGDHKWENFLVNSKVESENSKSVIIIDWEQCDIGDPSWDVGCGLASFVIHRLREDMMNAPSADRARFMLTDVALEMTSFWRAYISGRSLTKADSEAFANKAVRMMGARLLVAAFESCYGLEDMPDFCHALIGHSTRCFKDDLSDIVRTLTESIA